ncbi:MAG: chromosomal replication initiator protein DnaA, partial [Pseudomonadota bacterium]
MNPSRSPSDTPTGAADLWLACVERLAQDMPEQQFNTWIRPLSAKVSDAGDKVTLSVANRFKMDWVRAQYVARITAVLQEVAGHPVTLELALALRETPARQGVAPRNPQALQDPVFAELPEVPTPVEPKADAHKHRLNTALTFSTLVEGSANRMARAAAMHVAGSPGQLYNPLFVYGGVGLGKTHLVHAIGNQLLADKPGAKVLYIHAEQFVSDVVKSYQRKTFDEFKERYHSLDLLIIDDVQFFANKERTQEEFFNAFEALLAKKSHIVMTSDTYPKGLA